MPAKPDSVQPVRLRSSASAHHRRHQGYTRLGGVTVALTLAMSEREVTDRSGQNC